MIAVAGFMPHSPLLVESVGKGHRTKLKKTVAAIKKLAGDFAAAKLDTIVVISSHPTRHADAFSINLHDPYRTDLSRFGDLGAERTFRPDMALIDATQRALRRQGLPLTLDTDHALDHGATVPLLLLTDMRAPVKIMPITYSGLEPKEHAAFGEALRDVLASYKGRVGVIGSGDLSHALTKKSPLGERPEGKAFDQAVCDAVGSMGLSPLLSLEPSFVERAGECAYLPLLVVMGLLGRYADAELLAYEAPFGVGFLTARFHLV